MSNYNKLQAVLTEVFQLDQADLDFGIYRIMNQKRDAINDFLQNSLPTQVKELLAKNNTDDNVKIQADLDFLRFKEENTRNNIMLFKALGGNIE